jgi:hypothetical protein
MSASELQRAFAQPLRKYGIAEYVPAFVGDFLGAARFQQQGVAAVFHFARQIRARNDDRPAHAEELGNLGGKPVIVEGIRGAGLHQHIRDREEGRELRLVHEPEIDHMLAANRAELAFELRRVDPGADKFARSSPFVDQPNRQQERPHVRQVGERRTPGEDQDLFVWLDADPGSQSRISFLGTIKCRIDSGEQTMSGLFRRHESAQPVGDVRHPMSHAQEILEADRMRQSRRQPHTKLFIR